MIADINPCPFCMLTLENARLKEKARIEAHASGQKCWVRERTEFTNETKITIVGKVDDAQWMRLLGLLIEIENTPCEDRQTG